MRGFAVGWVVSAISVIAVAAFVMPSCIPVVHAKKMETTIMPIMRTWLTRWKNKRKEAYSVQEGSKER
ncbi:hypothetical protein L1049_017406 [Liquidambar formosana]|uniref:Uncharacterized protein n=1 Tax=Liquidambar formosana TaxID=63359 RepID=A0AAP0S7R9_LIQFO